MRKMLSVFLAVNLIVVFGKTTNQQHSTVSKNLIPKPQHTEVEGDLRSSTSTEKTNVVQGGVKRKKTFINSNGPEELNKLQQDKQRNAEDIKNNGPKNDSRELHELGVPLRPISVELTRGATDLFISELCDFATSGYTGARFLEIYNPGPAVVLDDAVWIARYANGGTNSYSISLTGTIETGDVYVVANNQEKFVEKFGIEADLYSGRISGNGDDTFTLSTSGYPASNDEVTAGVFDIVGEIGVDGDNEAWNYEDQTIVRNAGLGPNPVWTAAEWSFGLGDETFATPGTHDYGALPTYLFESFEGDFPPYGWSVISNNESNAVTQSSTAGGFTGSYSARFSSYSCSGCDHTQYLISPMLSAGGADFSFWYIRHSSYSAETFMVGVSTTDDDPASFVWGEEVTATTNAAWTQHIEDLSSYAGQEIYVAIKYTSDYMYYLYVDDVEGPAIWVDTEPVASISPEALSFGSTYVGGSKDLDITITNNGGGNLVATVASDNAKFTLSDFGGTVVPTESGVVTVTYTPTEEMEDMGTVVFTHNGDSSPDTVYVSGSGSANLVEVGFETGIPGDWTTYSDGTSNSVGYTSFAANSGSYSAMFSSYNSSATGYTQHLISPMISIPAGSNFTLSMWYLAYYDWAAEEFEVGVSTTDDAFASFTYGDVVTGSTTWQQYQVDLSSYAGQDVYISIRYNEADNYNYYGFVDDIVISPPAEQPILSIAETGITYMATMLDSTRSYSVVVSNSGVGDLSSTITYPDGFTGPATLTTGTGLSDTISVSYSPATAGIHSGWVSVASNGGNDSIYVEGNAGGSVATWDDDYDGDGYDDWPQGWEVINNDGGSYEWDFGGSNAHTGDGHAYKYYEATSDDWLISPTLDVVAGDRLTFYASSRSSYLESINIMLSTTGGNTVADFDVTLGSDPAVPNVYTPYDFDLSSYAGTQVRVAIQCVSADMWYLYLDDVATSAVYQSTDPVIYDYWSSWDFGTMLAGTSDTLLWDYYNIGAGDLEVTGVTFSGAAPFTLSSESSLPDTTTAGGVGGFDVVFSPPAGVDSVYAGTMTVAHNAGDAIVVALSGYGMDAVYYENFGVYDSDLDDNGWSDGWTFTDDGVECATDVHCTNSTGDYWRRTYFTSSGPGNPFLYHSYDADADDDVALTRSIELPAVADHHYELEITEYNYYGETETTNSGIEITTDGGTTFTRVGEPNYAEYGWTTTTHDLTGHSGTAHIAFVYQGTDDNVWAVDNITVRLKPDPIVPVVDASNLIFPVTAIGESSSRWLYYSNVGAGNLSATITYPADMTGGATITDLAPGETDSTEVVYTPTTSGISNGVITIDGTASNAEVYTLTPDANAGKLAFDFVDEWCRWSNYDLDGSTWNGYPGDWTWWGGQGHANENYAGVYSYADYWGGVDDWLVSPRFDVENGDRLSFWTKGGNSTGSLLDSMDVWIGTEKPIMGYEMVLNTEPEGPDSLRVDTGFVNMDAFYLVESMTPPHDKWAPVDIDMNLGLNRGEAMWAMIHSMKTAWMLRVDDLGTPDVYMNPLAVLNAPRDYNFGVTSPAGDSVTVRVINTGMADLVVDSMEFENGEMFYISDSIVYPVTVLPGDTVEFEVVWSPDDFGMEHDTLIYYSNYTDGEMDAYGGGTGHTIFMADAYNAPPEATNLVAPADGTVLTLDVNNIQDETGIIWMTSSDPDGTPVEYWLQLVATNTADTLDTVVTNTSFFLDNSVLVGLMDSADVTMLNITWDVWTTDGWDGTPSGNGPWSLTVDGGWVLGVDNEMIPEVFALHNSYPNPFNPVTNIRYDIPEISDVTIEIYNLAGQKIKTLVSNEHQPGRYKIQWNATNDLGSPVSTGMYIYRIKAKDFISVKRLLLMK